MSWLNLICRVRLRHNDEVGIRSRAARAAARLTGGIRNKAARGELRRGLPAGLIWGEAPGEIMFHPDEAVTGVIAAVFGQFAACGSARGLAVAG